MKNFILGTAQFGSRYGIANRRGQPGQALSTEIIRIAWENGIREFDTAQGYGESETALGRVFAKLGISKKVKVISKFHPSLNHLDKRALSKALDESLKKLGVPSLHALLLHRERFLPFWNRGLGQILQDFIVSGKVKKTGISVYSPEAALKAINTRGIDIIQAPANIFDRRFEKAGIFPKAHREEKEIHIRSVFLQGLLLLDSGELPEFMSFAAPYLKKFNKISQKLKMPPQELALGYIRTKMPQVKVIIGVEDPKQVIDNCLIWGRKLSAASVHLLENEFAGVSGKIIDPTLWKK